MALDTILGGIGDLSQATLTSLATGQAVSASRKAKRESRRQAEQVRLDALRQQDTVGRETQRLLGTQSASYGAAGIQQESGSAQSVFNETLFNAILANQQILTGARRVQNSIINRATAQDRATKRAAELQQVGAGVQGGAGIAKLFFGIFGGGAG